MIGCCSRRECEASKQYRHCAQDIEANKFWEAMGFVALAFRTGSEKKSRVHIFWQRRIRSGDVETPYWFPSQTTGGSIREDRLVLPTPPGVRWSDEMPRALPAGTAPTPALPRSTGRGSGSQKPKPQSRNASIESGGLRFAPAVVEKAKIETPKTPKKKRKNDARLISAARELRDWWLEQVNGGLVLGSGKYDVSRELPQTGMVGEQVKQITSIAA